VARIITGGIAMLLIIAAGLFWWQGRAPGPGALRAAPAPAAPPALPPPGDPAKRGAALPMPAQADPRTREQKRFDRYDRNRDGIVTRTEMLSTRTRDFMKLDRDHDNLLSFEEWAVRTSDRFATADANRDGRLSPAEFAATATPRKAAQHCQCD
jgi:hypothetical protein